MKRDLNLIRSMLLEIEASSTPLIYPEQSRIAVHPNELIYNSLLILEYNWTAVTSIDPKSIGWLTNSGQDALNLMRPAERWANVHPLLDSCPVSLVMAKLTELAQQSAERVCLPSSDLRSLGLSLPTFRLIRNQGIMTIAELDAISPTDLDVRIGGKAADAVFTALDTYWKNSS